MTCPRSHSLTMEIKIIVVDNASQDDSMRLLEERYAGNEQLSFIRLDDNYGFSYANNVGIRSAVEWEADAVLLLNNDTEIASDMLLRLWECAKRHSGSMVVPKIYYSDDRKRLWSAGGSVSRVIRKVRHIGLDETDVGQYDQEREIAFVHGMLPVDSDGGDSAGGDAGRAFFPLL